MVLDGRSSGETILSGEIVTIKMQPDCIDVILSSGYTIRFTKEAFEKIVTHQIVEKL